MYGSSDSVHVQKADAGSYGIVSFPFVLFKYSAALALYIDVITNERARTPGIIYQTAFLGEGAIARNPIQVVAINKLPPDGPPFVASVAESKEYCDVFNS